MSLSTNTRFEADLMDVVRLFFPQGAELDIRHRHELKDGRFEEWVGLGDDMRMAYACPAATGDALEETRAAKRAAKIAMYTLLKQHTGAHPPWGSLTGIRPTRLFYEAMQGGMTPERAEAHMVERYDVSPQRAALLKDIEAMQRGLIGHDPNAYDLYIGIPFCTTRCAYCSFSSGEIGKGNLVEPYIEALLREMALSALLMDGRGYKLRAAYMGGGTPTSLSAAQLDRVLAAAQEHFPGATEWTVEAGRPDTIDPEKLGVLKSRGIDRISINPQSFSDATLRTIGRAHTAADTVGAYHLAREHGFRHINMDLIAALPGESAGDFERTLERTIALDPESVTVHTLAIKHGSRYHEFGCEETAPEAAQLMVDTARDALTARGYRPYYLYRQKYMAGNLENVGYAKPGFACAYNIDIMEETCSILALGAGAITKWLFDAARRIERAPNLKNIEQYTQRVDEMVRRKAALIP